jgi:hypothetical protein
MNKLYVQIGALVGLLVIVGGLLLTGAQVPPELYDALKQLLVALTAAE